MSEPFEGPESARWIEPFREFLAERGVLRMDETDRSARLWPSLDTRLGWLAVATGYIGPREVYTVLSAAQDRDARFGELAIDLGVLRPDQVAAMLRLQASPFRLFLQCLVFLERVDGPRLQELVDCFAEREGLDPIWALEPTSHRRPPDAGTREELLRRRLDRVTGLATIPDRIPEVLELMEFHEAPVELLAGVIERDPALTTQLLTVVSRLGVGPTERGVSVLHAVESLGSAGVRQLVLAQVLLAGFAADAVREATALWDHSLRAALWCRALRAPLGLEQDPFPHGLLHELGRIVLLQACPTESGAVTRLVEGDATREQAERRVFGTTSSDIGAYVCGAWCLPESIRQAALYHATPTVLLREIPKLHPTTRAVHAACRLARLGKPRASRILDPSFLELHGLERSWIDARVPEIEEQFRRLELARAPV